MTKDDRIASYKYDVLQHAQKYNNKDLAPFSFKAYFSSATYILDLYHLYKKFKECLPKRKEEHKVIKDLLLSN